MKIVITNCRHTPKWESLQTIIREATCDEKATITRISRKDRGCDYRAPGEYELDLRQANGTVLPIELNVVGVGQPDPDDVPDWVKKAREARREINDEAICEFLGIPYLTDAELAS
jgi:hypothetical protein